MTIAFIPARGGSKGIPGKNTMLFCGEPLITWSIQQAISSGIHDVIVSTDDKKISDISRQNGAFVVNRPDDLSTDTATIESALKHAIDSEKINDNQQIVLLQPTSPVRRQNDIKDALSLKKKKSYDSLFSASLVQDYCLWAKGKKSLFSLSYDYRKRGRRQDRDPLYLENGSVYIFQAGGLKKHQNRLYGNIGIYLMPLWASYEIDEKEDIDMCAYWMYEKILKGS